VREKKRAQNPNRDNPARQAAQKNLVSWAIGQKIKGGKQKVGKKLVNATVQAGDKGRGGVGG